MGKLILSIIGEQVRKHFRDWIIAFKSTCDWIIAFKSTCDWIIAFKSTCDWIKAFKSSVTGL